jgi:hypothetical protein
MKRITFLPRHLAASLRPPERSVLISIHGCAEEPAAPSPGWLEVLHLRFDGSESETLEAAATGFSIEMARAALDFVHRHRHCDELVVDSLLGVSRSAAIALFFAGLLELPCFDERGRVSHPTYPAYDRMVFSTLFAAAFGEPQHPLVGGQAEPPPPRRVAGTKRS